MTPTRSPSDSRRTDAPTATGSFRQDAKTFDSIHGPLARFAEFVDFFHLQDLVTPDYDEVRFYPLFDNFERPGTPVTTEEDMTHREATLQFIAGRKRRMARWVMEHHSEIEVLCR